MGTIYFLSTSRVGRRLIACRRTKIEKAEFSVWWKTKEKSS